MNRRTLLSVSPAVFLSPLLRFPIPGFADQALAATEPVVSTYDQVGPAFDAARTGILEQGRAIVDILFSDQAATLYDRMTPDLLTDSIDLPQTALISREGLASLLPSLVTNRLHVELPEFDAMFDGHVADGTIQGFFWRGSMAALTLNADGDRTAALPLDGRWTGEIDTGDGAGIVELSVTFQTVNGELQGMIDIPGEDVHEVPFSSVTFKPTVPLGLRIADQAGPLSATNRIYMARHAWNDAALAVTIGLTPDGDIALLTVAPEWPLPIDPAAGHESTVAYQLPFEGAWLVVWGGDTALENYHVGYRTDRHAYDILVWNDGSTYSGDGTRNEDYWCYGQSLFAPAAGTVVEMLDGVPDNKPGEVNPEPHPGGNHLVIQTADGEFLILAHMKQNSLLVKLGDQVAAGDPLGLAGNSGHSTEPHLHIHLQNQLDSSSPETIGLPLRFSDYLANGASVALDVPTQGQFIARP
jgi:hypothetical protein